MPNSITALLAAVAFATLTGCGQMGPLTMPPPEDPSEDKPVEAAEPVQLSTQPSAEKL